MNHISIKRIKTQYGYDEIYWCIDGKTLPRYLDECVSATNENYLEKIGGTFDGLCPAWSKELDYKGDIRFVWELIRRENTVLPLLLCPEDLDFSCTVIVVEVEKTKNFVYWNKIGYVSHSNSDFETEKRSGILCTEAYTDDDWEMYGDNIALENVDSPAWKEWISANWEEELYRRRMNCTLPYFEAEENVCWLQECNWCFERREYEEMVHEFWELVTLEHLQNLLKDSQRDSMDIMECAKLISDLTQEGRERLEEHLKDYAEILLHLYASDMVSVPLIELLKAEFEKTQLIESYILVIEIMWKAGDEKVRNVVDVTILERLSDDAAVWQKFGRLIAEEFKCYINQEILRDNVMMWGVKPLK